MSVPRKTPSGGWKVRKRIPEDVREGYERHHGVSREATKTWPSHAKEQAVKREASEWLSEVEGRIEAIRAARSGTGVSLSKHAAAGLAGQWYEWFVAKHLDHNAPHGIEHVRDAIREAFDEATDEEDRRYRTSAQIWSQDESVREAVRPVLADLCETAQFLASRSLALNQEGAARFLDQLYFDLPPALNVLERRLIKGDYGPDKHHASFPAFVTPNVETVEEGKLDAQNLFEQWVRQKQPAAGTVQNWRNFFRHLDAHTQKRPVSSVTPEEAQSWITGLISQKRSARTVRDTWLRAMNAVFSWGIQTKLLARNPFEKVVVTVPRKRSERETKAMRPEEARTILHASAAIRNASTPDEVARRWVPPLCAYTGARPGEITQLRGVDVVTQGGIPAIRITPSAGTVKGGQARVIPLHEHLVEMGFVQFARSQGNGPLFYRPSAQAQSDNPVQVSKSRAEQARQRIAAWVRSLGITDKELAPSHAWRHTFKQVGRSANINEKILDDICGHAPKSVGASYGRASLADMAKALEQFPRYDFGEG